MHQAEAKDTQTRPGEHGSDVLEPVSPPDMPDEDETAGREVVVILEIPSETYQSVRPRLDRLIAAHGLTCHVRMDG